jgi:hypothetical protein
VAEILKEHAAAFVAHHPRQAAPQVQSTLAKLALCRTAALGGRTLCCPSCDHRRVVYHSCGDRHCPQCRGARRAAWVESMRPLLLSGVMYFQVVFTLPPALASLALGHRREMYHLLLQAAWRALAETIEAQCGFEPAALLVLHTWNQRLEHHPHVHALVPGGGPACQGKRWLTSRHPKHRRRKKPYLVDNRLLSARFRTLFLAGLKKLHRQGKLKLAGDGEACSAERFGQWLSRLGACDWVVYIEPPPVDNASPEQVLKYLARYLTGGPISDRRLISHRDHKVTFLARSGDKPAAGVRPKHVHVTLAAIEFTRRWCLHVLPRRFTKVRCYGGYSNRRRQAYLDRCRELRGLSPLDDAYHKAARVESDAGNIAGEADNAPPARDRCPHCARPMACLIDEPRRPWWEVMQGPNRPYWYRE